MGPAEHWHVGLPGWCGIACGAYAMHTDVCNETGHYASVMQGINLTAADTVIFYDNDWNPTMDA